MKIRETEFTLNRNGLRIVGTELRPAGNRLPIAIISHGFLSCGNDVKNYAYRFAALGYASYCFDFIGGGTHIKSDGLLKDMTVLSEKQDLITVMEYAKSLSYTNSKNITLIGFSQGGFVSAITASEESVDVQKLVLFFPALCIPDDARRGKMLMFEFDSDNIPDEVHSGNLCLGGDYIRVAKAMDTYELIKGYAGDVLIIHGDSDMAVDISYSEKAKEAYGGKCSLVVINGGGHGFNASEDEIAFREIEKFLKK